MSFDRVPEPELMDEPDQARAYSDADFAEAHDSFVRLFVERFGAGFAGEVLDLGCGPADPTVRLARALPGVRILGVDAGANMLALARARVEGEGLAGRVRFERHHLPDRALSGGGFDAVVSNSLLHHLPDPAVLWDTALAGVKPGGAIHVMDLLRPTDEAGLDDLVDRHAGDAPSVLRDDFRHSLRAAYRPDEVAEQLSAAGLGGLAVEAVSDRHLLVSGRRF